MGQNTTDDCLGRSIEGIATAAWVMRACMYARVSLRMTVHGALRTIINHRKERQPIKRRFYEDQKHGGGEKERERFHDRGSAGEREGGRLQSLDKRNANPLFVDDSPGAKCPGFCLKQEEETRGKTEPTT